MDDIGWMYERGFGVALDYTAAAEWYRKAIKAGSQISEGNLDWLYKTAFASRTAAVSAETCANSRRQSGLDEPFAEMLAVFRPLKGEVSLDIVSCPEAGLFPAATPQHVPEPLPSVLHSA